MTRSFDVGVVGAGVIGLAHAYQLARRGLKVVVFERHPRAQGASIRNFGMIWPVGQPRGELYQLARRSRDLWREVLQESNLWFAESGSLHVAYHADEVEVLREFVAESRHEGRPCELWTPSQIEARFPAVEQQNLLAGLWSRDELAVDPREVIAGLPDWLSRRYGVHFAFNTSVIGYDLPTVHTTAGEFNLTRLVIATGADFRELAPVAFRDSGMVPCKLQMMRSQPFGEQFRIGTHLCAGLTLRHYAAFRDCPTLPQLVRRLDEQYPEHVRYGIHVLVSQNGAGELTLGDTHVYGDAIDPFDDPYLDELVLDYLKTFLKIPGLVIASRWHGIYAKHPTKAYVVAHPATGVMAVTGVGGAGMTLSFGLAERLIGEWLE